MVAHAEFGQAMRAVAAEFCGATGRGAQAVLKPAFPFDRIHGIGSLSPINIFNENTSKIHS
jgi:hypothetical protein